MIRKASLADFDFIYELYMHPLVNPWILYDAMSKELFKPIYEDLLAKKIKYIYEVDDTAIGMCKLIPLQYRCAHVVYVGGLGIHPSFARKGHGLKMMQEIIEQCRLLNYKRIELSVAVNNEAALQLYQKAGFEKEGVLKKYGYLALEDRYLDEVMMAYLL